jgi:hypothetical protein
MNQYFDKNGLVAPFGENEILYAAYFHQLKAELYGVGVVNVEHVRVAIESQRKGDRFQAYSSTDTWSHDNQSGILSLMKLANFKISFRDTFPPDFWRRIHPRDIVSWLSIHLPITMTLFQWIPALAHIVACINKYESDGVTLATSGKLRAWLCVRSFNMPLTSKIINYIIKKKYGSWHAIFLYYFKDENHPCVILSKELK